ncbi:winged helix DNA-binding protein [Fluviicola sp.]|uniref:MarR family winged helix-turn-helix transcriptional regulator n=1 Tax=Fluviicola sp. TaxID=1917219 RepID=UPI0031D44E7E
MSTNYDLIKKVLELLEHFESKNEGEFYSSDLDGFKSWILHNDALEKKHSDEVSWEFKEQGRSPESVISTMLTHLGKYAKMYSKSIILDSPFSTQEEFIYLINLKAFGTMSKMDLIRMNIQDKPTGIQIINRLIKQGWVLQTNSEIDKRSKLIEITSKGKDLLEEHMLKIRQATKIVSGDLSLREKLELIRLLTKLTSFHREIYSRNIDSKELLCKVISEYIPSTN